MATLAQIMILETQKWSGRIFETISMMAKGQVPWQMQQVTRVNGNFD